MKKVIINSTVLLNALKPFNKLLPLKATLPVLETVLVEIKDNELTLTGSDLLIWATTKPINVESDGDCRFLMPRFFMKALAKLPNQPVIISFDEKTGKLSLQSEYSNFTTSTRSVDSYVKPHYTEDGWEQLAEFTPDTAKLFYKELKAQKEFRGTDDLRLNLTGSFLEFENDTVTITSTNANYLRTNTIGGIVTKEKNTLLIGNEACVFIASNIGNTLTIEKGQTGSTNSQIWAKFTTDNLIITARLVDEKYPDYRVVIPPDHSTKAEIYRSDLLQATKLALLCANEATHKGIFDFKDNKLTLTYDNYDLENEYKGTIDLFMDGDPIEIGFNLNLLITAVKSVDMGDDEPISFYFGSPSRAALIKKDSLTVLIMPMEINK